MTYTDLITKTYGENPVTGQLITQLINNSIDLIGNLVNLLSDDDINAIREATQTEDGKNRLHALVEHFFTELDVLSLTESHPDLTPFDQAGGLLAAMIMSNINLLKEEGEEVNNDDDPTVSGPV